MNSTSSIIAASLLQGVPGDRQTVGDHQGLPCFAQGWIGERKFGYFGKYRRLSEDYEYRTGTSEAMLYSAMMHSMVRRSAVKAPF